MPRAKGLDPEDLSNEEIEVPLYLGLANEEGYPHEGRYDYADSAVDPETGTLQLHHLSGRNGDFQQGGCRVYANQGRPDVRCQCWWTEVHL
jgi:hypothetical protein